MAPGCIGDLCCDMVTCLELWEHSGLQLAWTVHVPTPRLDTVDTLTTSERPGCQDHRRHSLDTLDTSTPVSTDTPSTLPRHSVDTVDTVDTSTHQGSIGGGLHGAHHQDQRSRRRGGDPGRFAPARPSTFAAGLASLPFIGSDLDKRDKISILG